MRILVSIAVYRLLLYFIDFFGCGHSSRLSITPNDDVGGFDIELIFIIAQTIISWLLKNNRFGIIR